jgi:hypothetical protein
MARLRLLPSQLEAALSELAGQGLAACDGFAGLRALCARAGTGRRRMREGRAAEMAAAGRWSSTGMPRASAALPGAERTARVLLDRLLGAPRMRVFLLRCPRCGEPMRRIAFVTDSRSITHILASLGEPTKGPHIAPAARGPS